MENLAVVVVVVIVQLLARIEQFANSTLAEWTNVEPAKQQQHKLEHKTSKIWAQLARVKSLV